MDKMLFPKSQYSVPFITTSQMIEVDKIMLNDYKINLFQMMENAGRCLATTSRKILEKDKRNEILIIVGSGGNGGGGITAARRLHNWGFNIDILLTSEIENYKGTIGSQLTIAKNMEITILNQSNFNYKKKYNLIIDAMIGYSLVGTLRQNIIELIKWVNNTKTIVVSLDVPSGIDSTNGEVKSVCIKSDYTLTLALPKTGFKKVEQFIGKLLLADISVPPSLYRKAFEIDLPNIFEFSDIVKI